MDVETPAGGTAAAKSRLEPRRALNAPDIEPLGEGRLRLDSSVHVSPLPSPQNTECLFRAS